MIPWVLQSKQRWAVLLHSIEQLEARQSKITSKAMPIEWKTYEEPHACTEEGSRVSIERSDWMDVDGMTARVRSGHDCVCRLFAYRSAIAKAD